MRLAEKKSRFVGTNFEALAELSQERSDRDSRRERME
jgi:hypothetical protein